MSDDGYDRPSPSELLAAVADTLQQQVLANTAAPVQHDVRVAAHLCRLVARQLQAEPLPAIAVGSLSNWTAGLRVAGLDALADEHDALVEWVGAKLAVDKPNYSSHGALDEAAIIER